MIKRLFPMLLSVLILSISVHAAEPVLPDGVTITDITEYALATEYALPQFYPTDIQTKTDDGVKLLLKTFEVGADVSPSALIEANLTHNGVEYELRDITRQISPDGQEKKTVSQSVTVESDSEKTKDILPLLPKRMDYAENGFTGQLLLDEASISTEVESTEGYRYAVTDTRQYPGLVRNDPYLIPKTVQKGGVTLTLCDVKWSHGSDYDPNPISYNATAFYYDAWCAKRPHENGTTQRDRIVHLRLFARFLSNNGVPAPTVFLPLPKVDKSFVPYIFTHDEIQRFLRAVDETKPCFRYGRPSLAHFVMPVLFRMLYCCGLRAGEALKLKTKDVDLSCGVVHLLETKGNRERLVPMSASLTKICAEYRANQQVADYGGEYFFPTPDNLHYAVCTVYARFREYLFAAGISHGGRGKGPRLHDLRHTFSVHTLNRWVAEGRDIYVIIPILCDYLGHKNLASTEKYLRLVPEAHALLVRPFEEKFGDVFPEVAPL